MSQKFNGKNLLHLISSLGLDVSLQASYLVKTVSGDVNHFIPFGIKT